MWAGLASQEFGALPKCLALSALFVPACARLHPLQPNRTATLHRLSAPPIMSPPAHPVASSSSNHQLIFNNALQVYERRTKTNLLAHPLAAQLQSRDTPATIITLLREQLQIQAQDTVDKLTKWLDPFVNVLHTLSVSLGEDVSLVCLETILEICVLFQLHRLSPQRK